jgi:hypothetical protein
VSAFTLAILLVAAAGALLAFGAMWFGEWASWLLRAGGAIGVVGLALVGIAAANLGLPRSCGTAPPERDRPAVSVFVGGRACREKAVGQLELPFLVGVAASAVVMTRPRRDSGR